MKPILSSLEGMTSMYMASQQGPHTAQSIRDIIAQLLVMPMFAGQIEDGDAEELARLIEEKYGISMGLGAIVDAQDFRPWLPPLFTPLTLTPSSWAADPMALPWRWLWQVGRQHLLRGFSSSTPATPVPLPPPETTRGGPP